MCKVNGSESFSIVLLGSLVLILASCAADPNSELSGSFVARGPEQIFSTPEQAVEALVDANRRDDKEALLKILGSHGSDIITSGDDVSDLKGRDKFISSYDDAHWIEAEGNNKQILVVGSKEWPMPIPLVRINDNAWQFDAKAGEQEILNRRISRNEINVIRVCRAYVDAQRDYAEYQKTSTGTSHFALHFMSSKGKHDGLYWPIMKGEHESPLGSFMARAAVEGYGIGKVRQHPQPYYGYYFKILTQQGPSALGGAQSYVDHERLTKGYALVAFPAKYGDSGVMTFLVNQNELVFEKNLGDETARFGEQSTEYNPDESWSVSTAQ